MIAFPREMIAFPHDRKKITHVPSGAPYRRHSGLSFSFSLNRHLRPSSGREHTIVKPIQSGDDDYLMNETRRKPTTGRQSPCLFDKWYGILYMPSRIDGAGPTKTFDCPVAEHWGETEMFSSASRTRTDNTLAHSRTRYQLRHPGPQRHSMSIY